MFPKMSRTLSISKDCCFRNESLIKQWLLWDGGSKQEDNITMNQMIHAMHYFIFAIFTLVHARYKLCWRANYLQRVKIFAPMYNLILIWHFSLI